MRALRPRAARALAVYAHPDDADVAAGGLLALLAREGCEVHLAVVCDGSKGSHAISTNPVRLREARGEELALAAEQLGVSSWRSLGHPDGEVANDTVLRGELVALVRSLQPELVLGPDPTATFFDGVYINHRDHRETGWALLDAVAPAAAMPLYFPDAGPPHQVSELLLSGTHEPDVIVDVSVTIDAKVAAVLAHGSQLGGDEDSIRRLVYQRAEIAGRAVGAPYGEAFRHIELAL